MNVLLAVDRSPATANAVEFLGRVLGGTTAKEHTITLFHVVESLPDDFLARVSSPETLAEYEKVSEDWTFARNSEGERLLDELQKTLAAAGFPESGVQKKLVTRESRPGSGKVIAALAIIQEMQSGDYEVVCLGRRTAAGAEGSFLGSVAEKVLREARGRTVWVVD